jgi:hypothetical protein
MCGPRNTFNVVITDEIKANTAGQKSQFRCSCASQCSVLGGGGMMDSDWEAADPAEWEVKRDTAKVGKGGRWVSALPALKATEWNRFR